MPIEQRLKSSKKFLECCPRADKNFTSITVSITGQLDITQNSHVASLSESKHFGTD